MSEPNRALRAARERLPSRLAPGEPLSRAELAEAVNTWLWRETGRRYALDDHAVGRWERGRVRWPIAPYRSALRAILGTPFDSALGFVRPSTTASEDTDTSSKWTTDATLRAATDTLATDAISRRNALRGAAALGGATLLAPLSGWLDPVTTESFASRRGSFSVEEVEALEHVTEVFRRWRSVESGLGRSAVLGQLSDVAQRLRGARVGPLTDRVFVAAAELARISASMAFDDGEHRPAQDHYLLAARLAKSGHDLTFGAIALSALARLQFDIGATDDGLEVTAMAQRGTRNISSPRLTSLLATRAAWGHAQKGSEYAFRTAVDSALEMHGIPDPCEPARLSRFDAAELHGTIGARYRDMSRHDCRYTVQAVEHVRAALDLRESDRARNRGLDLVSLARVQLIAREVDGAAESARQALPLVDVRRPGRLLRKLTDWLQESGPYRRVPAVDAARSEILQLKATLRNDE